MDTVPVPTSMTFVAERVSAVSPLLRSTALIAGMSMLLFLPGRIIRGLQTCK
jgi:hypothetical protein